MVFPSRSSTRIFNPPKITIIIPLIIIYLLLTTSYYNIYTIAIFFKPSIIKDLEIWNTFEEKPTPRGA